MLHSLTPGHGGYNDLHRIGNAKTLEDILQKGLQTGQRARNTH